MVRGSGGGFAPPSGPRASAGSPGLWPLPGGGVPLPGRRGLFPLPVRGPTPPCRGGVSLLRRPAPLSRRTRGPQRTCPPRPPGETAGPALRGPGWWRNSQGWVGMALRRPTERGERARGGPPRRPFLPARAAAPGGGRRRGGPPPGAPMAPACPLGRAATAAAAQPQARGGWRPPPRSRPGPPRRPAWPASTRPLVLSHCGGGGGRSRSPSPAGGGGGGGTEHPPPAHRGAGGGGGRHAPAWTWGRLWPPVPWRSPRPPPTPP